MKIMIDASLDEDGSLVLVIKNPKRLFSQKTAAKKNSQAHDVIAFYCERYEERYGSRPHVSQKTAGVAKRVASSMPLDRIFRLIDHYLEMNDFYFAKRCHDLAVFENSMNKVILSLEQGFKLTDKSARSKEQTDESVSAARSWIESGHDA